MFPALLILVAGGVLLAGAVPKPGHVRPAWLGAAGVIGVLSSASGAALASARENLVATPPFYRRTQAALVVLTVVFAFVYLACVRLRALRGVRPAGVVAFVVAVLAGSNLLHDAMLTRGTAVAIPPKAFAMLLQTASSAGAGALVGLAVMTALFPVCGVPRGSEADTGASQLAARAFRRMHGALLIAVGLRAAVAVVGVLAVHAIRPVPELWARWGALIPLRWLAGLAAIYVLATLARRRLEAGAGPSATALLLMTALLAADAEALALYLVRETGLPF